MLLQYSGRNSLAVGVPEQLRVSGKAEVYNNYEPFPCRVYDGVGNLKYEITREQLLSRQFKRAFSDFVVGKGQGKSKGFYAGR